MKKIISIFLAVLLVAAIMSSCTPDVSENEATKESAEHHESAEGSVSTTGDTESGGDEAPTSAEQSTTEPEEFIPEPVEIDPEHIALAENDYRYAWVVAFIGKDVARCEQILSDTSYAVDPGQLGRLNDLYFGSYSVEPLDDYSIKFDFEIVKSYYELFPAGKYSASVSVGGYYPFSCYFSSRPALCDEAVVAEYEDEYRFISELVAACARSEFPGDYKSDTVAWAYLTEVLFVYYADAHDYEYTYEVEITLDELRDVAEKVYAIDDFELYSGGYSKASDGKYSRPGHGGLGVEAKIAGITEENGVISFDIQYFGDNIAFSDAGMVRFTIERTNGEYPYRLLKIEKIRTTEFDIYRMMF